MAHDILNRIIEFKFTYIIDTLLRTLKVYLSQELSQGMKEIIYLSVLSTFLIWRLVT